MLDSSFAGLLLAGFERSPDPLVAVDRSLRVLAVNAAAAELAGAPAESLRGRELADVLAPSLAEPLLAALGRAGETGRPLALGPTPAQNDRWFAPRVLPGDGAFMIVLREVSEHRQIESALRHSEEEYRFLTEAIPQQIWTARPDGGLDFVNARVLGYFGRPAEEVLGAAWTAYVHPDDLPAAQARWQASLTSGDPYEVEFRLRDADGAYRWHIGRARAMRAADGAIVRWFGTNIDIDDQKRSEHAQRFILEASAELARSLDYEETLAAVARLAVQHVADWCSVVLRDGEGLRYVAVAHVDPAKVAFAREVQRRYPLDPEAPSGIPHVIRTGRPEFVPDIEEALPPNVTRDPEAMQIVRALKIRSSLVVPLRDRDRTIGAINLVTAESGRRLGPADLKSAEDLARRCGLAFEHAVLLATAQNAEHELRRLNEELERRVGERTVELQRARDRLAEANARLKELDLMKDEFLGALSNQLESPIHTVLAYTETLLEGAGGHLREEQGAYVRRIGAWSRLLLSLVQDLLDMTRMSGGKFALERERIDVCELAREVLHALEPVTTMQGHRVVADISRAPIEALADERRLEQVMFAVLHSAIQLTASAGLLRVSTEVDAGVLRFEVYHTGESLAPDEVARILHRFSSRRGAWLGLSIARRIIEDHGGDMGVVPTDTGGNTFWFTLPLPPDEPA